MKNYLCSLYGANWFSMMLDCNFRIMNCFIKPLFYISIATHILVVIKGIIIFQGKQGKMKEMYEQAVAESEGRGGSATARKEVEALRSDKARAVRERFERGEVLPSDSDEESSKKTKEQEDMSIFEEGKKLLVNIKIIFATINCYF